MATANAKASRPYLYELDPIRACTALGVIGVHAVAYALFLNTSTIGTEIQYGVITALHFTREIFLIITAFVLVYSYYGKPFNAKTFWRKRGLGVLLPYVIWSIYYSWVNDPHPTALAWLQSVVNDIVTGNASYQLYFILLTLQFYLVLPILLWFLRRYGHHPWRILGISFAAQLVGLYVDFHYVQTGPFSATSVGQFLNLYQWRILPFYQFYALLGAFGALYMSQVRAFVLRHGRLIAAAFAAGLVLLWMRYVIQIIPDSSAGNLAYATTVFQPAVVIYSITVAFFAYWLACRWAARSGASGRPRAFPFWRMLSDASFGVYLVQPIFINLLVIQFVVPLMPQVWPVALQVFLVWLLSATGSVISSILLLHTPVLSRLVGRPRAQAIQLPIAWWVGAIQQIVPAWRRRHAPRPGPQRAAEWSDGGAGSARLAARSASGKLPATVASAHRSPRTWW